MVSNELDQNLLQSSTTNSASSYCAKDGMYVPPLKRGYQKAKMEEKLIK